MIHDLDDHARRLGYANRDSLELAADVWRQRVRLTMRPRPIDPRIAFERLRAKARAMHRES